MKALYATITNQKSSFQITPKRQVSGNFISLVIPHISYCFLVLVGIFYAYWREGLNASLITNTAWALLNVGIFIPFILAALPQKNTVASIETEDTEATPQKQFYYLFYLFILVAFVIALSLLFFSTQSLRLDESQSLWQVSHTPLKILYIVSQDVHVPLYHFLLYTWQYFLGNAVAAARQLSLIFFCAVNTFDLCSCTKCI